VTEVVEMTQGLEDEYDVVVVGGGAAGLNGALMLARARRSVVVVDAGEPRNAPAEGVHGLLGHDGTPPSELLRRGREEVVRYGGQVLHGSVVAASHDGERFVVTLADGSTARARRLLVTTGLADELPDVPGVAERWGHQVLHCPYCHGWEVRDQAITVLGSGPMSVHQALLFSQWSGDITYVTHAVPPDDEQREQLAARAVRLVAGTAVALEAEADRLALRLADGTSVALQALVVAPRMVARAAFFDDLGLELVDHPAGVGQHVEVDPMGRTGVPGVWAAGNVTDLSAQVGASAAAGAFAGAQINADLVMEETREAVERRRGSAVAAR
jgi:thioredoxin reductase